MKIFRKTLNKIIKEERVKSRNTNTEKREIITDRLFYNQSEIRNFTETRGKAVKPIGKRKMRKKKKMKNK